MFKRFLAISTAVLAGFLLAQYAARQQGAPSWWPDRDRDRQVRYFKEVLQLVKENYVGDAPADYASLTRAALDGMVGSLDPHSEFLAADAFRETEDELANAFTGVGIQVEQRDGHIVIVAPIPGTPADRAGLQRGDRLVKIDGKALVNPTLDSTISLVRGEPGSLVTLTVFRPAQNRSIDYPVRRERIKLESVRLTGMRAGGVGYLQITQFSERTGEEFGKALAELEAQGLRALVIDLRNNPGGLLDAAIDVCSEFFDKDELIAFTQGRSPDTRESYYSSNGHRKRDYPVAILVNGGSASAAEIVAGAMRDSKRAVIVGEKSFGKGSVQSVIELDNGEGLRLTTARYYTPSGITIHERGILPHVEVEVSPEDEARIRVQQARPDLAVSTEDDFKPIEDIQLAAAEEVLAGVLASGK
ncbi:S41 family peptidase [Oleiharenicola lentus]|jgi:carboxyl-terminal processing protease|uniref:S41 family peptidase n=1 Tax=Oleiharenicola lentus TaxID=2508720 RepID=A0A4Q1CAV1_9BACT|nr:S41 family peptidase [Oleiharenicola lentus]RXK56002.1 S41 family peptidase [Oleiharenicola lentus]